MPIAFDNVTQSGTFPSSTSGTFSHTTSGQNRNLLVFVNEETGADRVSGVTYGGSALTMGPKGNGASFMYMFYLVGTPPAGANNVIINLGTASTYNAIAVSYTGCDQAALDGTAMTNVGTTNGISGTITTVNNNSWIVSAARSSTGSGFTAGANSSIRFTGSATPTAILESSLNPFVSSSTGTLNISGTNSISQWRIIMASLKAVPGGNYIGKVWS